MGGGEAGRTGGEEAETPPAPEEARGGAERMPCQDGAMPPDAPGWPMIGRGARYTRVG